MIKGAPVISEATAIPEASVTTEVQKYPAEVLRCSCSCFCGDQVQKLLLRFCFVGTLTSREPLAVPSETLQSALTMARNSRGVLPSEGIELREEGGREEESLP